MGILGIQKVLEIENNSNTFWSLKKISPLTTFIEIFYKCETPRIFRVFKNICSVLISGESDRNYIFINNNQPRFSFKKSTVCIAAV